MQRDGSMFPAISLITFMRTNMLLFVIEKYSGLAWHITLGQSRVYEEQNPLPAQQWHKCSQIHVISCTNDTVCVCAAVRCVKNQNKPKKALFS